MTRHLVLTELGNRRERFPSAPVGIFNVQSDEDIIGSFDSTTWFYETKKSWVNFDISEIPKNAHKNNTSQSLSLIAKGIVRRPPITLIIKPYLKSPHNIV
jgi:hypothetical protein